MPETCYLAATRREACGDGDEDYSTEPLLDGRMGRLRVQARLSGQGRGTKLRLSLAGQELTVEAEKRETLADYWGPLAGDPLFNFASLYSFCIFLS